MKLVLALVAVLAFNGAALAQHSHGEQKGPNGGPMEDVAGVHVELVASGTSIVLHIFDEGGKSVSTAGFIASVLVTAGANRETLSLAPQGQNALKGEAKQPVTAGATVSVTLKTAAGKSGQVRFKP